MAGQVFGRRWSVWMADTVLSRFPVLDGRWAYDYGVICSGLARVYGITGDEKYFDYIKTNMDRFLLPDGTIRYYDRELYNLDYVNNGKTLLYLYRKTGERRYSDAAALLRQQLLSQPRNSLGGFWHKKCYPWQMWLDGIYMAQPFYAEYLKMFGKDFPDGTDSTQLSSGQPDGTDSTQLSSGQPDGEVSPQRSSDKEGPIAIAPAAVRAFLADKQYDRWTMTALYDQTDSGLFADVLLQFRLADSYMKDPETHLLYHGWDEKRECFWADPETGLSANFWGRSIGWYACALVDTLDHIEEAEDREVLISMVRDLAGALISVQSKDTCVWYEVPDRADDPANYPEASCSCMFVYFLLKAVRKGYIDRSFLEPAKRGFYGVIRSFIEVEQDDLLTLKGTVYGAGLGGDDIRDGSYEYYVSEPRKNNHLLGIGPFLMAASEMERDRFVETAEIEGR